MEGGRRGRRREKKWGGRRELEEGHGEEEAGEEGEEGENQPF